MEPDQFKLVFNAVCFLVTKDAWEEKKEEKEKERELSAYRDGDDLIDPPRTN